MKPAIIAICGEAAVGKDSLLRALAPALGATKIVSDTTRPPRPGEVDGTDYNFISEEEFVDGIRKGHYLEWKQFNGWYYGTPHNSVCGKVNIGVFNLDGVLDMLAKSKVYCEQAPYNIFVIRLKVGFFRRIIRYVKRDGKLKFECLRRMLADARQFYKADILIDIWLPQHLVLKNFNIAENLPTLTQYIVSKMLPDYYI